MISKELEKTLNIAVQIANDSRHEFVTTEHLLLSLLDNNSGLNALDAVNCDIESLRKDLMTHLADNIPMVEEGEELKTQPSIGFQRVLQRSIVHVQSSGKHEVEGENVLVALFSEGDSYATYFLDQQGISRYDVVSYVSHEIRKDDPVETKKIHKTDFKSQQKKSSLTSNGAPSLFSDSPSKTDHLSRQRLLNSLVQILSQPDKLDPLTIGLFGDWGTGKTSFIKQLLNRLSSDRSSHFKVRICNAWEYENTDDIQAGIAQEVISGLTDEKSLLEKFNIAIALNWAMFRTRFIITGVAVFIWLSAVFYLALNGRFSTVVDIGIGTTLTLFFLYRSLRPLFSSTFANEFFSFFNLPNHEKSLGSLPIYKKQINTLSKICLEGDSKFLFIIDDLDRCSSKSILSVLEAIRLVFEMDRVVVMLAIDHRIVLSSITLNYAEIIDNLCSRNSLNRDQVARDYLGKIIGLPIYLKNPEKEDVNKFVNHIFSRYTLKKQAAQASSDSVSSGNNNELSKYALVAKTELDLGIQNTKWESMRHNKLEIERFSLLCDYFAFSNPRQIKRLLNSYRLMLATLSGNTNHSDHDLMIALFTLEYGNCNGLSRSDRNGYSEFISSSQNLATSDSDYTEKIERFFKLESIDIILNIVAPFVLPTLSRTTLISEEK